MNLTSLLSRFTCQSQKTQCYSKSDQSDPEGVLPNEEVGGGGLGPHIKFGGKIWGKVRPSSQNKRKNLGSLSPQDAKVGKKS